MAEGALVFAAPTVLENPGLERDAPVGPAGVDLALEAEGLRLQFEDAGLDHRALFAGGIEVFVIEDTRGVISHDPFTVRPEVSLGGAALDLVA